MKKRILLTSICTIVLSLTLLTGATFALFTSESKTSITVSAGNVEVESVLSDLKTYSLDVLQNDSEFENEVDKFVYKKYRCDNPYSDRGSQRVI